MDRAQLEALRRQVEEDYKLDIAAIERLQRRFQGSSPVLSSSTPSNTSSLNAYSSPGEWTNFEARIEQPTPVPPPPAPPERRSDELEGSLRTMFSAGRK